MVFPDLTGLAGIADLEHVAGALLTIVLVVAVVMLIVSAIAWATGTSTGNPQIATRGRLGVLVSLAAAVLAGAGIAWINWLITLGQLL